MPRSADPPPGRESLLASAVVKFCNSRIAAALGALEAGLLLLQFTGHCLRVALPGSRSRRAHQAVTDDAPVQR